MNQRTHKDNLFMPIENSQEENQPVFQSTRERLPFREKFFYGLGDAGFNLLFASISFYLTYFLINVGGLEARLTSIVLIVGKVWDAFVCFFMGYFADKTENKRFGNRRVYLIFDALPFGASFVLLWLTPISGNSQSLRVVYYIFAYIVFTLLYDIGYIPYNAISASMTMDYDERTAINGYRIVLANIGILVGAAVFAVLADGKESVFALAFGNLRTGYLITSSIYAVCSFIIILLCGLNVKERVDGREMYTKTWCAAIKEFFHLKEFRCVTIWYVVSLAGFDIIMSTYMFYINDALKFGGGMMAMVLIAIPLVSAIASAAFWVYLSEKFAKESVYALAAVWMSLCLFVTIWLPEKVLWPIVVVAIVTGAGMSAIQILPFAAVPDVCDIDEFVHGERREGIYYGILQLFYKILSGVLTSVATAILGAFGYVESNDGSVKDQPASAKMAIRIILGVGPSIFFLIAIIPALRGKITRERLNSIKEEIAKRKQLKKDDSSVNLNEESVSISVSISEKTKSEI